MARGSVSSTGTKEYDALLELLREMRMEAKISQEKLSQKLNRPISWYGKVELGTRRLDVVEFIMLCQALGQDPAAVIGRLAKGVG